MRGRLMHVPLHTVPTYAGWEEDWLEAFVTAAQKGAGAGTSQAIAWAKVCSKRVRNPAVAEARETAGKRGRRARLGIVPPPRKGKPTTWRPTPSGAYRARLGTLPEKWKQEWVRRYKSALRKQERRKDLSDAQQKTIAAKQAWDAIKKQGCRLSKSARPRPRKSEYVPPNKRARDRDKKYQGWICPEWESTEQARQKVIEEVRREAKGVEQRERKRAREAAKARKKREATERRFARARKKTEKAAKEAAKRQTSREYGEVFRRKRGALAPEEAPRRARGRKKKSKVPTAAQMRIRREHAPKTVKEFDARKTYKVGDIISHHRYGYGEVVEAGNKEMTVKFEKRGKDLRTRREIKVGGKTAV